MGSTNISSFNQLNLNNPYCVDAIFTNKPEDLAEARVHPLVGFP